MLVEHWVILAGSNLRIEVSFLFRISIEIFSTMIARMSDSNIIPVVAVIGVNQGTSCETWING
jgi:hypothetical protein